MTIYDALTVWATLITGVCAFRIGIAIGNVIIAIRERLERPSE